MKWIYLALFSVSQFPALAATYTVAAGSSSSTIQATLNSAPQGSTIAFEPGTYTISNSITIPCNNLTITGPNVFPNTAILNAAFNTSAIFNFPANCTAGLTLEYLAGYNTSLFYMYPGNAANINILHNTMGNLPSSKNAGGPYAFSGSVYFNGTIDTSLTNVTIEYNSFGDANSCTAVFSIGVDYGGNCAGFMVHQGKITNLIVKYNKFFHLEEGLHILATSSYQTGQREATADNVDIEYNYFLNIHRIEVEDQIGTINHPHIVSNNIYQDQSYAYYGSLGASLPCCQNGGVYGKLGLDPGMQANNNVYINSVHDGLGCLFCGSNSNPGPAFTVEFWGNGSQGNNNLIQGNFGNGFEWGYGSSDWQIEYNQICGPNMARQYANIANYISNEEGTKNPPTQVGNVTSASCNAITSVPPTIAVAAGNGTQIVTLIDPGLTSGPGPHGNTSVYYTADGSTPVPGSGTTHLYTGPFAMASGMVNAVGLYGSGGNNPQTWPTTYPAGYGYVPSPVVTATISGTRGTAPAVTLVSASLSAAGSAATMATGTTLQFTVVGKYSDGSGANLPDAHGNSVTAWTSSSTQVASISSAGLVTAVASGTTNVGAMVGSLSTSPWVMTITAPPLSQNPPATLVRAYLGMPAAQNTIVTGTALQFTAYGVYSDGSVAALPDTHGNAITTWSSTSSQVGSISNAGTFSALSPGTTNIWAKIGNVIASPWGMTVTAAPKPVPTLVRAYLGTAANQDTIVAGNTVQVIAYGVYSDGSTSTLPDAQGNGVSAWTSTAPQTATVNTEGVAAALLSGATSIGATVGSVTVTPLLLTITSDPATSGPAAPGAPLEDTFLGPFWKLVNPAGGTASISNDHLYLNVPAGGNHDTLASGNQAVRAMQTIGNNDFDVAVKIDSPFVATNGGTQEGIMVTSNASSFITFGLAADGTNIRLIADAVASGTATVALDITNFTQYHSPTYLRLSRTGSAYIAYYSLDGASWTQVTSFTYSKTTTSIGVFGSNFNSSPALANPLNMSVNWFHSQR